MRKLNDWLEKGIKSEELKYQKNQRPFVNSDLIDIKYFNDSPLNISNDYFVNGSYPFNRDETIRLFCDPTLGDDDNDGTTWAKAVETLDQAVKLLPTSFVRAVIIIPSGITTPSPDLNLINSTGNVEDFGLHIIALMDGVTDPFFTNDGERTLFGTTPLILTGDFWIMGKTNLCLRAIDSSGKAWGMIKIQAGTVNADTHTGMLNFDGVIFDTNSTTKSVFSILFGNTSVFLRSCEFRSAGNVSTGNQKGAFNISEGSRQIYSLTTTFSASYPCPFSESLKITDFKQLVSFSNVEGAGFSFASFSDINADQTLDVYIGALASGFFRSADANSSFALTGTNKAVTSIFSDVTISPPLPTADPLIVGALWNSSGVVTVSAG